MDLAERGLWDLEKLVLEFRKLFDDKTSYLNLYGPQKMIPQRVYFSFSNNYLLSC